MRYRPSHLTAARSYFGLPRSPYSRTRSSASPRLTVSSSRAASSAAVRLRRSIALRNLLYDEPSDVTRTHVLTACKPYCQTRANLKTVLNIIWLVLAGFWLAISYAFAALLLAITIIGLPFAKQSLKLAGYALWPFGRTLIPAETRGSTISVIGNILWFVLAGWWLALIHLIIGCLLCITIIGIPLGIATFKMAGAALVPFGKQIVRTKDLRHIPPGDFSRLGTKL